MNIANTATKRDNLNGNRRPQRTKQHLSNVIIVGVNKRSFSLAHKILENPKLSLNLLGFVDEMTWINDGPSLAPFDIKVLGGLEDFQGILEENVVDKVFITLPIRSYYLQIHRILEICETIGVEVSIPPDLFSLNNAKVGVCKLDGIPHISFHSFPASKRKNILKRLIDVALSSTLLMFVSPLLLFIMLLIKLTSRGPVFYQQERAGYHNRVFKMLKFRSMVKGAEDIKNDLLHLNEMEGPVFKIREDPRITPLGKVLRKLSLDELPQLINVLKGDMSLVGPRPAIPEEVNQYDPWQRRRQSMKPGITCYWQVSGRNQIPFKEWMKLDLKYIDNWSFKQDLMMLLKTIPAIRNGHGAS